MKKNLLFLLLLIIYSLKIYSQPVNANKNPELSGHVLCNGKPVAFANVIIEGTTIGTVSNNDGFYKFKNIKPGNYIIKAGILGYESQKKKIKIKHSKNVILNFNLKEDALGLNEVVVTGDRSAKKKSESSVIVNTITPKVFSITHSVTFGDALNYSTGLRVEDNCENCGFSQVRMNGLEGPYSQILINSRPVFSGLASVYGLDLIPSNLIKKIEIVRGGGSVLYGSNAIAGTINIILKDPVTNSYEAEISSGLNGVGLPNSGRPASDNLISFNTSLVSNNYNSGFALFGFNRKRNPFDANGDGFSELPKILNTTVGARFYQRINNKSKINLDFFNINEYRRGGDRFNYPVHEALIAEAVRHELYAASADYKLFIGATDLFTSYFSGQKIVRHSYYGANQSLSDYGLTRNFAYNAGIQYKILREHFNFISGLENTGGNLNDQKLGYPDFKHAIIRNDSIISIPHTANVLIANQETNTTGLFSQIEYHTSLTTITLGARLDRYQVKDLTKADGSNDVKGLILSPRINILYSLNETIQFRVNYSRGYRAPQIFDEDLHIETSGSRQVIHQNAPGLKAETSNSFMGSIEINKQISQWFFHFMAEAFYTHLNNPFVNEFGLPDKNGVVIYTRTNSSAGAVVKGLNFEMSIIPSDHINFTSGFTQQISRYDAVQEFNTRDFFRTPNNYGFMTIDYDNDEKGIGFSATLNYTGKMLVPYFGPAISDPSKGVLRISPEFWDAGCKIRYSFSFKKTGFQLYAGIKNIFNSYQKDFDRGVDRDPAYVYGPSLPRSIYFGVKIGNLIKKLY